MAGGGAGFGEAVLLELSVCVSVEVCGIGVKATLALSGSPGTVLITSVCEKLLPVKLNPVFVVPSFV